MNGLPRIGTPSRTASIMCHLAFTLTLPPLAPVNNLTLPLPTPLLRLIQIKRAGRTYGWFRILPECEGVFCPHVRTRVYAIRHAYLYRCSSADGFPRARPLPACVCTGCCVVCVVGVCEHWLLCCLWCTGYCTGVCVCFKPCHVRVCRVCVHHPGPLNDACTWCVYAPLKHYAHACASTVLECVLRLSLWSPCSVAQNDFAFLVTHSRFNSR